MNHKNKEPAKKKSTPLTFGESVGGTVIILIVTVTAALVSFLPDEAAKRVTALNEAALEEDAEMNAFLIERTQELFATYRLHEYGHRSWDELASSHLSLSEKDIRNLDAGKRPLSAQELITVGSVLGISMAQLLNPEYPLGVDGLPLRIAQRRIELGMNRATLAAEADLTTATLNRLETGQEDIDAARWRRIAAALDIDPVNPGPLPPPPQTLRGLWGNTAEVRVSRDIAELMTAGEWLRLNRQITASLPTATAVTP